MNAMNLLCDPVFRVQTRDGLERMSLPQLLTALGTDRVESLAGLQRHQEDAFHIFLCYLAGAVLAREGCSEPIQDEEFWRNGIRRLTGRADDCAWTLVVEDVTQPAFMQAPLLRPGSFESEFSIVKLTPDALDLLLTGRSHDIKAARAIDARPDEWIYALISLQTMAGYILKHQGIARMNSGLGSRPCVSLIYGSRPGERWLRDTRKLLGIRSGLLVRPWPYRPDGVVLTWLSAWDRQKSLSLDVLDPFFLEICRAVRCVMQDGRIVARTSTEKAPRINAKDQNGILGDPWIPINMNDRKKGSSALTVSSAGLTPELLRNLIFEEGFQPAAMQQPDAGREAEPCTFCASVLVRGQGTTDGFHSVALPIPSQVAPRLFRRGPERDRLAALSKTGIQDAGLILQKVLKPALFSLLEGGPESINFDKREVGAWVERAAKRFAEAWNRGFFPWLWRSVEHPDPNTARREWLDALRGMAWTALQEAVARSPERSGRHYRARVQAEGLFHGCLFTVFPMLKEAPHEHSTG